MVTLTRQRGHSHTTVRVHVRWRDLLFCLPTHGPHTWTPRVPTTTSRIDVFLPPPPPSPHLNRLQNQNSVACVWVAGAMHEDVSMFRTKWSASRRTLVIVLAPSNSSPSFQAHASSLTLTSLPGFTFGARKQLLGVCFLSLLRANLRYVETMWRSVVASYCFACTQYNNNSR